LPSDENIFSPERHRIDAELARDAVQGAFDGPGGLNLTGCPGMPGWHFVGIGAPSINSQIGNSVAAPSRDDRVVRRGRGPRDIGACVHHQVDLQRGNGAVELYTHLGLEEHGVPGILLEAVLRGWHQLDWPTAELPRQK